MLDELDLLESLSVVNIREDGAVTDRFSLVKGSTALVIGTDGTVRFSERSFGKGGTPVGEVREVFEVAVTPCE